MKFMRRYAIPVDAIQMVPLKRIVLSSRLKFSA
jgi:hypothetical protein